MSGGDENSIGKAACEEHLLTGHTGAVVCLAMYEDRLLFSGSTDCTIKVLITHSLFRNIPVFPNRQMVNSCSLPEVCSSKRLIMHAHRDL